MQRKTIYITENDMKRLRELIMVAREFGDEKEEYLCELEKELNKGQVVPAKDAPKDVITMNSEIFLKDLNTNEEITYKLVFPEDADIDKGWVSVLAPIGTALLGYKVGDTITWQVPAGTAKWKVQKILYQPEAAGDFHL